VKYFDIDTIKQSPGPVTATILRDLTTQAEWACACVAASNFYHDESGKIGRRYGMTYSLEAPGEPDITMEVWRSQRGVEVRRVRAIEDEVRHMMEEAP